jgi:hypothetical protein
VWPRKPQRVARLSVPAVAAPSHGKGKRGCGLAKHELWLRQRSFRHGSLPVVRGPQRPISVQEAREIAVRAHGDQKDRDGSPHIAHVARVAEGVPEAGEYQRVAWLHDVLEDSDITSEQLRDNCRLPRSRRCVS